jgi:hypothetical protein
VEGKLEKSIPIANNVKTDADDGGGCGGDYCMMNRRMEEQK